MDLLSEKISSLERELINLKTHQTQDGWYVKPFTLYPKNPASSTWTIDEWRNPSYPWFTVKVIPHFVGDDWSPIQIKTDFLLGNSTTWDVLSQKYSTRYTIGRNYPTEICGEGYLLHFSWNGASDANYHFRINIEAKALRNGTLEIQTNPDWEEYYYEYYTI